MESSSKEKMIIYIKDGSPEMMTVREQRQNQREITNLLIDQLGQKYYQIKFLFEKLNIKRDELYYIGKELENSYKDVKKDIHLTNQQVRTKDSLYCWFAQHFYSEIFDPNSSILDTIIDYKYMFEITSTKEKNKIKNKIKKDTKQNGEKVVKVKPKKELCNITENLPNLKMNQEIDDFEIPCCSRKGKFQDVQKEPINLNFDFSQLLDF